MGIFVGSVYGNSQHVAEEVSAILTSSGFMVDVLLDPSVSVVSDVSSLLFITSTTGEGDIPPNLEFFIHDLREQRIKLENKPFALVALGDSSYGDSYCGAGKKIFSLLTELRADAIAEMLEVDACETLEPEIKVVSWIKTIMTKFQ
ncbi:MAG: flavodoxin domain-containing protein [Paraglaciecola sp.]|uniref:flavodoxin domain-containing protein n=1 Tax=Paraglaciecola sp. TaxID=1920173 RepID=UPI00329A4837